MKILLLEDDPILGEIIEDFLNDFYQVKRAFNASEADSFIDKNSFDLFIFDINLPNKSGINLLSELREFKNQTPTIFITAYDDISYLKKAFERGAIDYLKKPFELEELKLRIEKVSSLFCLDDLIVEIEKNLFYKKDKKCIIKDNKEFFLKPKEAKILEYFLSNRSRLISKDELVFNLWSYDEIPTDATLRSYIRNLRNLIGQDKITTQRGMGYRYE